MANHTLSRVSLLLLLLVAAALRFYGLDWDGGIGAHPDERYVAGVAEGLHWPDRLNPFDVAPDLAYGHLPLYLLALAGRLAPGVDLLLVGRALAALFDLGTVALTFALGRRIYGESVGLLAAAFVALTALHVQQAHFYTADVPLTFFVLGALFFAARLAECGRPRDAWLAGACAGLALGTKFSAALLVLPLGAACVVMPGERRVRWRRGLEGGATALAAFALTNPFALLELCIFWRNVAQQAAIARGVLDVPYTRQFHATWPYLYPAVQQLRWGMGWPLGLLAFAGLAYGVWRAVQEPPRRAEWVLLAWVVPGLAFVGALYAKFPRYLLPLTPLLALYAARVLLRGKTLQRSGRRSLLRLVSVLGRTAVNRRCWNPARPSTGSSGRCGSIKTALLASQSSCLSSHGRSFPAKSISAHWKTSRLECLQPLQGWLVSFLIYSSLIYSFLHCLAFVSLYRSPHPWLAASEWFGDHVPCGAVVAVEHWDHPLPLSTAGGCDYDVRELPIFDEDTPEKWVAMEEVLAEADYVVIASRRGYATLARWLERYPRTAHYYRLLFEGGLGFEPVACLGRYPQLGPLALVDDPAAGLGFSLPGLCRPKASLVLRLGRLDESFVVYDHPQVVILWRGPE